MTVKTKKTNGIKEVSITKAKVKGAEKMVEAKKTEVNITIASTLTVLSVSMNLIEPNPYNPRSVYDPDKLTELKNSIQEVGLIHRPVARLIDGKYQLVAGYRRWKAALELGWTELPIEVKDLTDQQMALAAITENLQRDNVTPIDDAKAIATLVNEFKMTQGEVARTLSVTQAKVSQLLSLLSLTEPIQNMVANGELSQSVARIVATLDKENQKIFDPEKLKTTTVKEVQRTVNITNKLIELLADTEIHEKDHPSIKFIKFIAPKKIINVEKTVSENYWKGEDIKQIKGLSMGWFSFYDKFPNGKKFEILSNILRTNTPFSGYAINLVLKDISNLKDILTEFIEKYCPIEDEPDKEEEKKKEEEETKPVVPRETKEQREQRLKELQEVSPVQVLTPSVGKTKTERLLQMIQEHRKETHELTDRCYNCKKFNPDGATYRERCTVNGFRDTYQFERYQVNGVELFTCHDYRPTDETVEQSKADGMDIEHSMFELLLNQVQSIGLLYRMVPELDNKKHPEILEHYRQADQKDKAYLLSVISRSLNLREYGQIHEKYILTPAAAVAAFWPLLFLAIQAHSAMI